MNSHRADKHDRLSNRRDLHGYSPDYLDGSDSEREMLQENYNTIF
jgi:hypothetical protein